jgi:catechol 2,3-dioxygenase-like lactoylglutathione lyase family enzyme
MKVRHYGLGCRSEETADRFYEKLLGLKRLERKTVPAELARAFFGLSRDLAVLNYAGEGVYFEIFVHEKGPSAAKSPAHICLEIENLDAFLERCRAMDVPVIRAPRGEQWITFIRDYDGNLFEIKEVKA